MNIREQLKVLVDENVEFLVVGGQAGVLRQAIEFSHDLDVLIAATPENAARVRKAVERIAGVTPDLDTILGRDFQQYIHAESGSEIDVHLKLIAIPGYAAGQRNASDVDYLGLVVPVLELRRRAWRRWSFTRIAFTPTPRCRRHRVRCSRSNRTRAKGWSNNRRASPRSWRTFRWSFLRRGTA